MISPSRALLTVTAEVGYCETAAWGNDLVLKNSCKYCEYKTQDLKWCVDIALFSIAKPTHDIAKSYFQK